MDISKSYIWPVKISLPGDTRTQKSGFEGEFRRLTQTEIEDIAVRLESGDLLDRQLVREFLVGWKGIKDESGDVAFSESALDELLDICGVPSCIAMAWRESINIGERKN